jgi:hypothetical protein
MIPWLIGLFVAIPLIGFVVNYPVRNIVWIGAAAAWAWCDWWLRRAT